VMLFFRKLSLEISRSAGKILHSSPRYFPVSM
jgi:hypothetical protein